MQLSRRLSLAELLRRSVGLAKRADTVVLLAGHLLDAIDGGTLELAAVLAVEAALVAAAVATLPVRPARLGERVAAMLARLVRVRHLSRALSAYHAIGPRAHLRRRAVGLLVADGTRVSAAAAREAQPPVRVLVVRARALVWQRLAHRETLIHIL